MLVLHSVCLGGDASDEMHSVEVQSLDSQGRNVVATIATLKPSVQLSVPLLGLNVKPPVTLKLKAGSGPIYISGQYCLEAMSDHEDDDMEDDIDKSPIFPSQKRSSFHPKSQAMVSMEQKYFDSADDFMTQDKLKNEDSPKVVPEATGDHTATSQVLSVGESSAVDSVTSSPGHLYSCTRR
uniref:nucleophosmin-like n=1 Tax=Myxine glutinosa TaxID=7769 RepID=UPI00358F57D3